MSPPSLPTYLLIIVLKCYQFTVLSHTLHAIYIHFYIFLFRVSIDKNTYAKRRTAKEFSKVVPLKKKTPLKKKLKYWKYNIDIINFPHSVSSVLETVFNWPRSVLFQVNDWLQHLACSKRQVRWIWSRSRLHKRRRGSRLCQEPSSAMRVWWCFPFLASDESSLLLTSIRILG